MTLSHLKALLLKACFLQMIGLYYVIWSLVPDNIALKYLMLKLLEDQISLNGASKCFYVLMM
jgi:hypothetical protein